MGSPIPVVLLAGLDAFAAEIGAERRCRVCVISESHPELYAEVLAGRRRRPKPHSFETIASYLLSRGVQVTKFQLRDHFALHEDEPRGREEGA